jgi:threonine aldolase
MLESGAWLRNGAHGNACARRFAESVAHLPGIRALFPVEANAVFLAMPAATMERLRARGWRFYTFIGGGARFMFAWDAATARVDALIADLRALAAEAA